MNREIKFRAWSGKQMLKQEDFSGIAWSNIRYSFDRPCPFDFGWHEDEFYEDYELMQYTGLKDKNGVEIYEGDILKGFTEYSGRSNRGKLVPKVAEVFWCDENAAWSVYPMFFQWRREDSQLEVIGNIYENPDLLKENK